MYEKQHTLKQPVSISGRGLHTGAESTLTFHPAPENHGFVFRRIDVEGQPLVRADVDNVVDTSRGTTIAENGVKVHTIEHTLAALVGLQIDNCLIDISGPEPPIMDGSSIEFVKALKSAGFKEQEADREFFVVDQPIHYHENDRLVDIAALPQKDEFRVTVMIDYNSQVLSSQHASMLTIDHFESRIADSRTFCFLHELEQLVAAGLVKGGDLDNAIVIVDKDITPEEKERLSKIFPDKDIVVKEGILNNLELRHKNEPARHKLLDVIGDLALIGAPIKGQIMAARPGHKANVEFARKIKAEIKQQKIKKKYQGEGDSNAVFDINAIHKILPHRYPFVMVDRITHFSEERIEGYKNVTINEPFFQGHFPGNPVMPGVLQLEAMAQVGGILLLNKVENPEDMWVYFLAIDNARFKKMVTPGDTLRFELEMVSFRRNICKMQGKGFVGEKLVCSADLTAALVPKDDQKG